MHHVDLFLLDVFYYLTSQRLWMTNRKTTSEMMVVFLWLSDNQYQSNHTYKYQTCMRTANVNELIINRSNIMKLLPMTLTKT